MIALSWSRLNTYIQCPRKFHLQFISKSFKEEEKSIHLVKGEQLHKQMEDYVLARNGVQPMPLGFSPEVRDTISYVDKLFANYSQVHAEAQVACDKQWKPCEWFGGPIVAWRAIWDVIALNPNTVYIGDYKSGKVYDLATGFGQLHLSAAMALTKWPNVPEVNAAYVYMEHKKIQRVKVVRERGEYDESGKPIPHLAQVIQHFEDWFDRVQRETEWAPQANEFCKWCPATRQQCPLSRKLG